MKLIYTLVCVAVATISHAGMKPMSTDELAQTTGRSGAEISLDMKLNLDNSGNFSCPGGNTTACRLAFAPHNRGNNWIVLKGLHGQVTVDDLRVDGVTSIGGQTKSGVKLTFDKTKPIKVRNLGFNALNIEQDVGTTKGYLNSEFYGDFSSTTDPNGGTGYNNSTVARPVKAFDAGRELGFLGVQLNGNIAIGGSVTVFGFQR